MKFTDLSDQRLLDGLRAACFQAKVITARIVAYLVEVEERSLHKRAATSMLDFCKRVMMMSPGAACRRINAARLVKRFPQLLGLLESGKTNISALEVLGRHLTAENVDELMAEVSGKNQDEIEAILVRRSPKPDVPAMIYALAPAANRNVGTARAQTRIEPLSPERHALHLTITGETRAKLEHARDLMSHSNPTGDLATVVDRALDALIAKLEKTRLGKTDRPRASRGTKEGTVSQATRREVFVRDGEQCTHRDIEGTRCPARKLLQLDHVIPRALGGSDEADNLRVTCRSHNSLYAEQVFGKDHMRRAQRKSAHLRQQRSAPAARPGSSSESDEAT